MMEHHNATTHSQESHVGSANTVAMLKNLVYVSIISADNDKYPESIKQEILERHSKAREGFDDPTDSRMDWEYILSPLGEDAKPYIKLLKS